MRKKPVAYHNLVRKEITASNARLEEECQEKVVNFENKATQLVLERVIDEYKSTLDGPDTENTSQIEGSADQSLVQ